MDRGERSGLMVLFLLVVFCRVLKAVRDNLIGLMEAATLESMPKTIYMVKLTILGVKAVDIKVPG